MALASPRAGRKHRPGVPQDWTDEREHRRLLAEAVNDLRRGKMNNTGRFVLPGIDLDTIVYNTLVEAESHVSITPVDEFALTRASGGYWVETFPGRFELHTDSTHPQAEDATFSYAILS